jgi:hypothetical protein
VKEGDPPFQTPGPKRRVSQKKTKSKSLYGAKAVVHANWCIVPTMNYPFLAIQAVIVLVLVGVARLNGRKCQWNVHQSEIKLILGISIVVFVQLADFIVETTENKGLGILYHIQWIGVYWIALAIFRGRYLREAKRNSGTTVKSPTH